MSQRDDLIAICELLASSQRPTQGATQDLQDKSNSQLLAHILERLGDSSDAPQSDEDDLLNLLSLDSLPDSLAFPERTRKSFKLKEASEFWHDLEKLNDLLRQDYTCRRQMLLNRLDCTVESFKWKGSTASEAEKPDKKSNPKRDSLNDQIHERYDQERAHMNERPDVSISHLLTIRETDCDKLLNGVVSSQSLECKVSYKQKETDLKQIIIPHVPDRGGRASDIRPTSKETFAQQRRARGKR